MEKILLGLAVLFFAITGLFYYFLSSFNAESRRQILMNRIAGVKTERTKAAPTVEIAFFPTKTVEPTAASPVPQEVIVEKIALGNLEIEGKKISMSAVNPIPTVETLHATSLPIKLPWADFAIQVEFPDKIIPGSSDNKFIFQNKEYEIKLFSQVGTENSYLREKFYAEKTGKEIFMVMYKISGNSIIINRETGWWEGGEQVAVGVGVSDEEIEKNAVRFFIE